MQTDNRVINIEFWKSFFAKTEQNNYEVWNRIDEFEGNDRIVLEFSSDQEVVKKVNKMTKNTPNLLRLFFSIVSANSLNRYDGNQQVGLIIPGLNQEDHGNSDDILCAFSVEVLSTDSLKEQFVKNKIKLAKAMEMEMSIDEVRELEQELFVGVRVSHTCQEWCDKIRPELTIDWTINEEELKLTVNGRKSKHDTKLLQILGENLLQTLNACSADPYSPFEELNLQSELEIEFLREAGQSEITKKSGSSIVEIIEKNASTFAAKTAVEDSSGSLSYRELNQNANQLSHALFERKLSSKDPIIGVMIERGAEMVTSILAIWKLGGAYIPIEGNLPEDRVRQIIENAKLDLVITNNLSDSLIENLGVKTLNLDQEVLNNDEASLENLNRAILPEDLAYVIYTSGSTGLPKGVMIEHFGMLNHIEGKINDLGIDANCKLAQNAPCGFDISVWQMFAALLKGGTTVIYSDETVFDCDLFVDQLNDDEITLLELVPSYLTEILLNFKEKENTEYFKKLQRVVLNAEPLLPWMVDNWLDLFPEIPIYNTYGATEVSDDISHYKIDQKKAYKSVPVLKETIQNAQLNLIDEKFRLVPPGSVGEIILSGNSVGRGYLNDEERTNAVFLTGPIENVTNELRIYKTGDLARFVGDGALEFIGRVDKQIKINGQRVELGAVEHALAAMDEITNAVVLPNDGNTSLIAFYTGKELDKKELQDKLADKFSRYMVPSQFLHLEQFPLSSNGKIQRSKLAALSLTGSTEVQEYVEPETKVQKILVEIWASILDKEKIGLHDDFFELGGQSLKIMNLFGKIRKSFEKKIEIKDLFEFTSLVKQAELIENAEYSEFLTIPKIAKAEKYPVSSGQKRLWILSQVPEVNVAYNMPGSISFKDSLNVKAFKESIQIVLARHEVLRTVFDKDDHGNIWQKVIASKDFHYDVKVYTDLSDKKIGAKLRSNNKKAFDLEKGPLFRLELFEHENGEYTFYFNVHHIISDGWSEEILTKEIFGNYELLKNGGKPKMKPLRIHYKDYASWQIEELKKEKNKIEKEYWINRLSGELPVLNFPSQKVRPKLQTFVGQNFKTVIAGKEFQDMKNFCQAEGGSLFSGLLTVWNILCYRYLGEEDIMTATPVARRDHADLENQIGFYVNTLVLRNRIDPEASFKTLYEQVKDTTIEAYSNQMYPFDQLLEDLDLTRDISRNSLFDVMMIFQNSDENFNKEKFGDKDSSGFTNNGARVSKCDIELSLQEGVDHLHFGMTFNPDVYESDMIIQLMKHFKQLMKQLLVDTSKKIKQVDFILGEERELILNTFNQTGYEFPSKGKTIIELFENQALKTPNQKAIVFEDKSLTYQELDGIANQFAHYLAENHQIDSGEKIGVSIVRDEWMMPAFLAVLKLGAAYVPVDPSLPQERFDFIQKDSAWKMCITKEEMQFFKENQENFSRERIDVKALGNPLTYIIYTSGSTGLPKGVEIENDAVVNFVTWSIETYGFGPKDTVAKHLNMSFDASVEEVYPTLLSGATLNLLPKDILLNLPELNDYLETNGISILALPPTLLDSFFLLDNKSLRLIILGGGKIKNYQDRGYQIANHYGPTEATVTCLAYQVKKDMRNIPIGKPIANVSVYILDDYNNICPIGVTGEICISGVGLAKGYLNREELTQEKFIVHPFVEGERLYRTGDSGKWLADGNVEFNDRVDNQVKIRGYRIELGEIDFALLQHKEMEEVVISTIVNNDGEKEIVAYFVAESEQNIIELRDFLKESIPEYMIPSHFVQLAEFPLTANGKVDKKKLPNPEGMDLNTGVEYVAPSNELEEKLVAIWQTILQKAKIGLKHDFFVSGGHSLKATRLISEYHRAFNVKLGLKELFIHTTLESHATLLNKAEKVIYQSIPKIATQESYPASDAQARLWVLSQIGKGSGAYNMPSKVILNSQFDIDKFKEACHALVARHEILRTVFKTDELGNLNQWILTPEELNFEIQEIDYREEKDLNKKIQKIIDDDQFVHFDLENGPLIRATLIQTDDNRHVLYSNMHHIISDGWSMNVISGDVLKIYNNLINDEESTLPELEIQYKDYADWQNKQLNQPEYLADKTYWLEHLSGELPLLKLPSSVKRPSVKTYNGRSLGSYLSADLSKKLISFTQEEGGSLFMGLLANWNVLLSRYTGQQEFIIGSPIAGRDHPDLEPQIGFYANNLALRNKVDNSDSFRAHFEGVKKNLLTAYSHQMYPFGKLVEDLDIERDPGRNALFDMMISLHNLGENNDVINLTTDEVNIITDNGEAAAKFDLSAVFQEMGDYIAFDVTYNSDIYDQDLIEQLMRHFKAMLSQLIANPEVNLDQIDFMFETDKSKLLNDFNNTKSDYPKDKSIIDLFVEQVQISPDAVALVFEEKELSYQQLDVLSNQFANFLNDNYTIAKEDLVSLELARNEWCIIAILAVLKLGAAYVPVDSRYPQNRIDFIKEDTNCVLSIDQKLVEQFNAENDIKETFDKKISTFNSLAYVMYTSGSTGTPKGVLVEHQSVVRLVKETNFYQFDKSDTILSTGAFSFDATTFEFWGPLLNGGKLVLCGEDTLLNPNLVAKEIKQHEVNVMWFTVGLFNQVVEIDVNLFSNLKTILVGGDKLNANQIKKFKTAHPEIKLINGYGPTENTTFSLTHEIVETIGNIPIGKPINNSNVYIFDQTGKLAAPGIVGEICVGGAGLARGYLNQPELTKEKFVVNPFDSNERLYKTGDLGRWMSDGFMQFVGRKDSQVKIRGYRIEVGELEQVILNHAEIDQAVVLVYENEQGEKELVAYYSSHEEFESKDLSKYIKLNLPGYMAPAFMMKVAEFPVTINGKIDRKKLPNPLSKEVWNSREFVEPENEAEEKLAELWCTILQLPKVSVLDSFFEVGGNSIKIIKLSKMVNEEFERDDKTIEFFQYPTIRSYAEFMMNELGDNQLSDELLDEAAQSMNETLDFLNMMDNEEE